MKKTICFLMLTILFTFFSACSDPEPAESLNDLFRTEEVLPQYDAQNEYIGNQDICRSENAYYFSAGDYLWYYDLTTKEYGKLCAKPECTHDDWNCNAFAAGVMGLCWYDEKLYWAGWEDQGGSGSSLFCIQSDGTNRQRIQKIISPLTGLDGRVRLHRGYLYAGRIKTTVENGEAQNTVCISQEPIGGKDSAYIILDKKYKGEVYYYYTFHKNECYIVISYDTEGQGQNFCWELYRFNTADRKLELLIEEEDVPWRIADIRFENDGICLVQQKNGAEQYELRMAKYELQEKQLKTGGSVPLSQPLGAAVGSGYCVGYRIVSSVLSETPMPYLIFDNEGRRLREGEITMELTGMDGAFRMTYYGGHEKDILLWLTKLDRPEGQEWSSEWLIQIPLDKQKEPEILFSIS